MKEARKQIMEYECHKAILVEDSTNFSAWFVPGLYPLHCPMIFDGLPGIVLEFSDETNNTKLVATNISFRKVQIQQPTEGKAINMAQLKEMENKYRSKGK